LQTSYRKRAKAAPARPKPSTGSSAPAPLLPPVEEVPEPEAVAVGVEPEPPTSEFLVEAPLLPAPEAPEDPEGFREPVLTVLLPELPDPELPVARGAEPAALERVGMAVGVPAGEVATAGCEVMTDGSEVKTSVLTSVLTGGWPVTTPTEFVWVR